MSEAATPITPAIPEAAKAPNPPEAKGAQLTPAEVQQLRLAKLRRKINEMPTRKTHQKVEGVADGTLDPNNLDTLDKEATTASSSETTIESKSTSAEPTEASITTPEPITQTDAQEPHTQESRKTKEQQKKENDMHILKESGAVFIPGEHKNTRKYYVQHYGDFLGIEKSLLQAEEQKIGRKLTETESAIISMKAVKRIQERNESTLQETTELENAVNTWILNKTNETGKIPDTKDIAEYRKALRFKTANQEDFQTIYNKEKISQLYKETSPKEWAAFIAAMIALLGKEVGADFMPKA